MPAILDISTAVPEFLIEKEDLLEFYTAAMKLSDPDPFIHKLNFLNTRTRIEKRYSCLPDFKREETRLYANGNYSPSIEKRMEVYKEKVIPLACDAIDKLLANTGVKTGEITHLITVSCTGLTAPGIEFQIAERYGFRQAEKIALNFLGCYAAIKALKQACYISQAHPEACVLIVCAELCSLHFYPSSVDEDIIANLLFADGASAVLVCGDKSKLMEDKIVLRIDDLGTAYIPDTLELMTWNITASNFSMFLSKHIASTIRENIRPVVCDFLKEKMSAVKFWAIHPGGVKIVEAVRDQLELQDHHVEDSMRVLQQYGNMSSPTILFILSSIFNKIRNEGVQEPGSIFSCAFGPGINIEMIRLTSINMALLTESRHYAVDYEFEV